MQDVLHYHHFTGHRRLGGNGFCERARGFVAYNDMINHKRAKIGWQCNGKCLWQIVEAPLSLRSASGKMAA
jgi:hypothetical protein